MSPELWLWHLTPMTLSFMTFIEMFWLENSWYWWWCWFLIMTLFLFWRSSIWVEGSILGFLEALRCTMFGQKLFRLTFKHIWQSNLEESIIHAPIWSSNFCRCFSSSQDGPGLRLTSNGQTSSADPFTLCYMFGMTTFKICLICHKLSTCQPLLLLGFAQQVDRFVHRANVGGKVNPWRVFPPFLPFPFHVNMAKKQDSLVSVSGVRWGSVFTHAAWLCFAWVEAEGMMKSADYGGAAVVRFLVNRTRVKHGVIPDHFRTRAGSQSPHPNGSSLA